MTSRSHLEKRADRLLGSACEQGEGWMWLLATARIANGVAVLLLPAWLGRAVDALVSGAGGTGPLISCAVLVVVIVVGEVLADVATGGSTATSTAWLRTRLVRHLLALGPRATDRFERGDLVTRVVGNAAETGRGGVAVVQALSALVPSVGSVVALLLIDPWLALAFLVGLLVMFAALRVFVQRNSESIANYQRSQGRIAARLTRALGGARTIAAAGTAEREAERVLEPLPQLREHGRSMWSTQRRAAGQTALVMPLVEVLVLAAAGWAVVSGRMTPGELFAASRYAALGTGITSAVGFLNRLAASRGGARRCQELLDEPLVEHGAGDLPPGLGRLQFRAVTATEGGRVLLDGIDLMVPPGRTLAVVGHSGAGKSTLAALAGRLRDPDFGEVLLDRMPLSSLDPGVLRAEVTYAFERPALLGDTIGEALAMGRPLDESAVRSGAEIATADEFVRRLPEGYDTELDTTALSGGEVQRLGLARAFAGCGRLLVLDDATSSLDTVTEMRVNSVVTAHPSRQTRLVVAHRATTAAHADLVAWLESGTLRALDTHERLWSDPDYRAVFEPRGRRAPHQPAEAESA